MKGLKQFILNSDEDIKILVTYRVLSLSGTSFIYITISNHDFINKFCVVLCMTLSSMLLSYLFVKNKDSVCHIKLLVWIETLGNSLILIPSGGFYSPYVWYVLNTFLIASMKLKKKYAWRVLLTYLIASLFFEWFCHNNNHKSLVFIIQDRESLILGLVLMSLGLKSVAILYRRIEKERKALVQTNKQLILAHQDLREALNYIISLYQTVLSIANQKNKPHLIRIILEYTKKITKSKKAFFIQAKSHRLYENQENKNTLQNEEFERLIVEIKNTMAKKAIIRTSESICIRGKRYRFHKVQSLSKDFGLLCIEESTPIKDTRYITFIDPLRFISDISALVFEKYELEIMNEELIVSEEQNRIANEIHDSVLQRLFSVSCGMYALLRNSTQMKEKKLAEELNFMRNTIDKSMKQLRCIIYGLSNNSAENIFEVCLRDYMKEVGKLNQVVITLVFSCQEERLSTRYKKVLYRIISECIGNAIRHGQCSFIEVKLCLLTNVLQLVIIDDGIGFEIEQQRHKGLGLRNIIQLTKSLNGCVDIKSQKLIGTTITVTLPMHTMDSKGAVV